KQLGIFRDKLLRTARSQEVRKGYVEQLARRAPAPHPGDLEAPPVVIPPDLINPKAESVAAAPWRRYRVSRVEGDLAVLEAGSAQGLRFGQELKVYRSDAHVANVRVTSTIRPDQCVIRVHPGTVRLGDYVELQAATALASRR